MKLYWYIYYILYTDILIYWVQSPAPPRVLMCPWARHLTLNAPDELAVALHGWLCRRCVNVCINWCKSLWIKASAKCRKCKCKTVSYQSIHYLFLQTFKTHFPYKNKCASHNLNHVEQRPECFLKKNETSCLTIANNLKL